MRVGQKNRMQRFGVTASFSQLVCGGLPEAIERDRTEEERQSSELLVNVSAKAGINEQVASWMPHQSSGHRKFAPIEERAPTIGERRVAMVHTSHHREDGQFLRR